MSTIELRRAEENDIANIMLVYKACVKQMNEIGLFNWNENYPSILFAKADIEKQQLYIAEIEDEIVGCMSLLNGQSIEYIEQLQLSKSDSCITIKRLAVHPKFQNKGVANELMDFAEEHALTNKIDFIRLDAYINSHKVLDLYRKRNYTELGLVQLTDLTEPCVAFERKL